MYAIIKTGGKQYRVSPGEKIKVEKLDSETGGQVELSEVLAVGKGQDMEVGSPLVQGARVKATVVEHGRGRKIMVYRFKRRKGYHKKQGHRQDYTLLKIDEVLKGADKGAEGPEGEE